MKREEDGGRSSDRVGRDTPANSDMVGGTAGRGYEAGESQNIQDVWIMIFRHSQLQDSEAVEDCIRCRRGS